jgi:hypothetical protein
MSRMFAGLAVLLGAVSGFLLTFSAENHTYNLTLTESAGDYIVEKPKDGNGNPITYYEIDFDFRTTFNVTNRTGVSMDFMIDAGPNDVKCRVNFLAQPGKGRCDSETLTIADGATGTLVVGAADMFFWQYSWMNGRPRFPADVKIAKTGDTLKSKDPDLELEREPFTSLDIALMISTLLSALAAYQLRRRN